MKRLRNPGHYILSRHYAHRWAVLMRLSPIRRLAVGHFLN
jgi:hypothetical protein